VNAYIGWHDDKANPVCLHIQRRWHHALGNALWHTDSSYASPRAKYSLLCCHKGAIPGTANTGFADPRRAYDALPEDKKAFLEDLIVEHE
jgi:alpha-ketoglutarate-dependent 2,4-dichlorophenoxyacetate dioxygenase